MKLFYSSGLQIFEGDRILFFHRGLDRWVFGQIWYMFDFAIEERLDGLSEKMPWAILAGDDSAQTAFWIFGSETDTLLPFELVFALRGIVPQDIQDRFPDIEKCVNSNDLKKNFEVYFADVAPREEDREAGRFTNRLFSKRFKQMKTYRGAMYVSGIEVKLGDVVLCEDERLAARHIGPLKLRTVRAVHPRVGPGLLRGQKHERRHCGQDGSGHLKLLCCQNFTICISKFIVPL